MDEIQDLGTIVKRQRNRLGFTITELAPKSGVSPSHIARIEKDERYPSPNILRKIAKPLNIDEQELFNLAGYLPVKEADLKKHKYLAELDILINRATAALNHIKSIIRELHKSS